VLESVVVRMMVHLTLWHSQSPAIFAGFGLIGRRLIVTGILFDFEVGSIISCANKRTLSSKC
jgi:hypothetical protein